MRFLLHTKQEYEGGNNITKGQVNFTKDNEYYTPKNVVKYFGEFDYDPATTKGESRRIWSRKL